MEQESELVFNRENIQDFVDGLLAYSPKISLTFSPAEDEAVVFIPFGEALVLHSGDAVLISKPVQKFIDHLPIRVRRNG